MVRSFTQEVASGVLRSLPAHSHLTGGKIRSTYQNEIEEDCAFEVDVLLERLFYRVLFQVIQDSLLHFDFPLFKSCLHFSLHFLQELFVCLLRVVDCERVDLIGF